MSDCLFCKIIKGEIPSDKVYEDDVVYAFKDIDPKAPNHFLIIPKKHYASILDVPKDIGILDHIHEVACKLSKEYGFDEGGFRLVNNCGDDGGQTVKHLHYHLLGGRSFSWPPG